MLIFTFRPGSVIVHFILYFKTALTPEKGIENLRVAISSNGTFGNFKAKDLVLFAEESTNSNTTAGIKGLDIQYISVIGLHAFSRSYSVPRFSFYSSLPFFSFFPFLIFLLFYVSQLFANVSSEVLHLIETVINRRREFRTQSRNIYIQYSTYQQYRILIYLY